VRQASLGTPSIDSPELSVRHKSPHDPTLPPPSPLPTFSPPIAQLCGTLRVLLDLLLISNPQTLWWLALLRSSEQEPSRSANLKREPSADPRLSRTCSISSWPLPPRFPCRPSLPFPSLVCPLPACRSWIAYCDPVLPPPTSSGSFLGRGCLVGRVNNSYGQGASFFYLAACCLDWVALNYQMEDGTGRGKVNGNLFGDRDAHPAVET
jgi:hypothetical protein